MLVTLATGGLVLVGLLYWTFFLRALGAPTNLDVLSGPNYWTTGITKVPIAWLLASLALLSLAYPPRTRWAGFRGNGVYLLGSLMLLYIIQDAFDWKTLTGVVGAISMGLSLLFVFGVIVWVSWKKRSIAREAFSVAKGGPLLLGLTLALAVGLCAAGLGRLEGETLRDGNATTFYTAKVLSADEAHPLHNKTFVFVGQFGDSFYLYTFKSDAAPGRIWIVHAGADLTLIIEKTTPKRPSSSPGPSSEAPSPSTAFPFPTQPTTSDDANATTLS